MNRNQNSPLGRALLVGLACSALLAESSQAFAYQERIFIRGGRIIPVSGPEIEEGAVLIEGGKITAVGKGIETPYDAQVIDATGKVVFPGMIEAHWVRGMDRVNESYPVTPFLSVMDSLDGASFDFEDALREGVTTMHVIHGNAQPIAGRGVVARPLGRIVENMAVIPDAALKISFIPRQFASHVSQYAEMRRVMEELRDQLDRLKDKREDDAEREKAKKEEDAKKKDAAKPADEPKAPPKEAKEEDEIEKRKRVLFDLIRGRVPAFVAVNATEVPYAIEFARKNGFLEKTTFVLGADAWKMVDAIAATGRPVVLDPDLTHRERDPITGKEIETEVAPIFAKKGVKFALQSSRGSFAQRYLNTQAAAAVRSGVDRDAALKAITLWPAEMVGLGDRLGALEKGRDGNVVILSGDPLSTTTFVEKVVLDGAVAYEREKDPRLQRLLQGIGTKSGEKAGAAKPGAATDGDKKEGEEKK